MIGWLLNNRLAQAVGAALAGLLALLGYGAMKKRQGRSEARTEAERKALEKTNEAHKAADRERGVDDPAQRLRDRSDKWGV